MKFNSVGNIVSPINVSKIAGYIPDPWFQGRPKLGFIRSVSENVKERLIKMSEVIYTNTEGNSNKFWSYEIDSNHTTTIKWGRVGSTNSQQVKKFSSSYAAQNFIDSKIAEKTKKGYKKVTKAKLNEEVKTANALGVQNKIKRLLFVGKKDKELNQLDKYDPKQFVYVEVLNSWSKEMHRILLSKENSWWIEGGISEANRSITFGKINAASNNHEFITAVRDILKKFSEAVVEALKSVNFAALGVRNLFDDDSKVAEQPNVKEALASVESSAFDPSVVSRFASMGARVLEL